MAFSKKSKKTPKGKKRVYSSFITRNGKRIYASTYGLKCFCFEVDA